MLLTTRQHKFGKQLRPLAIGLKSPVVCVLLLVNLAATSLAADLLPTSSVTLGWDTSTGTNVSVYKIYYGTTSGSYTQAVSVGLVAQATITGLKSGTTYYFTATAYDYTGLESDYSNETSFSMPAPKLLLSLRRIGTKSVVQWPTNYPGYTLQWCISPKGTWASLTTNAPISGSYYTYTNSASATQRYYRLKK